MRSKIEATCHIILADDSEEMYLIKGTYYAGTHATYMDPGDPAEMDITEIWQGDINRTDDDFPDDILEQFEAALWSALEAVPEEYEF